MAKLCQLLVQGAAKDWAIFVAQGSVLPHPV